MSGRTGLIGQGALPSVLKDLGLGLGHEAAARSPALGARTERSRPPAQDHPEGSSMFGFSCEVSLARP